MLQLARIFSAASLGLATTFVLAVGQQSASSLPSRVSEGCMEVVQMRAEQDAIIRAKQGPFLSW